MYIPAVLLIATGIILTGSGAGISISLLALFLMGSFTFYFSKFHQGRHMIRGVFTVIIIAIILWGVQQNLGTIMKPTNGNIDYSVCWSNSLELFSGFPLFGSGFGSFKYIYFLYDTGDSGWITHAHNDYLETFSDGGIIGGLLFLLLIGGILFSLFRMWSARRNPEVKAIGLGVLAGIFSAGFHSLFGFAMRIPAISFLFVLILVCGLKMASYKREFRDLI